jgi:hypothetical protein
VDRVDGGAMSGRIGTRAAPRRPPRPPGIAGLIGSAAAFFITLIGSRADAVDPLGIPPATWAFISAGLAGLVVLGRMAQGVVSILRGETVPDESLLIEELPMEPTDVAPERVGRIG